MAHVSFSSCEGDIPAQVNILLSYFTHQHLIQYGRTHLWVNPEGQLFDFDIRQPGFETVEARRAWVKGGGWRYSLLNQDDKRQVASYLNRLEEAAAAAHISSSDIQGMLKDTFEGRELRGRELELNVRFCQYLELLLEYLIWDLLMNITRYSRQPATSVDQNNHIQNNSTTTGQVIKAVIASILPRCRLEVGPGLSLPRSEISTRMRNLLCILGIYMQEARYKGLEQKKRRGGWGKELLQLLGNSSVASTTSTRIFEEVSTTWTEGLESLTINT